MASVFDEIEAEVLGAKSLKAAVEATEAKTQMTPLVAIFEEKSIRILGTVEDPLFSVADVAAYIDDTHNCARVICKYAIGEYKQRVNDGPALGGRPSLWYLTEAGLYKYLLQAKGEKAEEFQRFVYKLLKGERKRTVDSLRLAIKIGQAKLSEVRQNEEKLYRVANRMREENTDLKKKNKKLLRDKQAREDADFLQVMGRDLAEEPESGSNEGDESEPHGSENEV